MAPSSPSLVEMGLVGEAAPVKGDWAGQSAEMSQWKGLGQDPDLRGVKVQTSRGLLGWSFCYPESSSFSPLI